MIIIRQKAFNAKQKDFSYTGAKRLVNSISKIKGIGNKISTGFNNAGLRTSNYAKELITGKPAPYRRSIMFVPKSKEQLKDEALRSAKKMRQTRNAVVTDPYKFAGKKTNELLIQPTIDAPLGSVASKALPVPGMTAAHAKTTAPLEKKMWDKVGYGEYTVGNITRPSRRYLRNQITNDRLAGAIRGVTNGFKIAMT